MSQHIHSRATTTVLIVDDSAFMRTALSRMIASDPDVVVLGTAGGGSEALEKIAALDPDVVTLDIEMPGLNGLETLRLIMAQRPRPVIMVSSVNEKDAEITFAALGAGAFDYVPKHLSSTSLDIAHIRDDLIAKIKAAAQTRRPNSVSALARKPPQTATIPENAPLRGAPVIVAIGISTGGPKALEDMLPLLPRDLSVPILIVQHMPPGFTAPFARRLNGLCSVSVHEAVHQEPIQAGVIYIAPAGIHMTVARSPDTRALIALSPEPAKHLHIPSVDILMESVAEVFGSLAMGIIMTGMGSDGAIGMRAIQRAGGLTVGQDEDTCVVYGMPRVCAERGILHRIVPLSQIPQQILRATHYRKRA